MFASSYLYVEHVLLEVRMVYYFFIINCILFFNYFYLVICIFVYLLTVLVFIDSCFNEIALVRLKITNKI